MTIYFDSWKVVKDGIETVPGYEYQWISKADIMTRNMEKVRVILMIPGVDEQSLRKAFMYAYRYFHAMTKYSLKTHPEVYRSMMMEYQELKWHESNKGFTARTSEGLYITVFRDDNTKWKWVFDGIFSNSSYKNMETAKKKAYASYYWLYKHILARTRRESLMRASL